MNPVVVHIVRPYSSEQEYLDAEAWSIDQRGMVLIGAEPLRPESAVLFDVTLADGQKPIRAEGRVVGTVTPSGDRPGGLKVRFKRFGAATKAFIERAVKAKTPSTASVPEAERPGAPEPERASAPDAEEPSGVRAERVSSPNHHATTADDAAPSRTPREASGTQQRRVQPVDAPPNREALLARLRQRRQSA